MTQCPEAHQRFHELGAEKAPPRLERVWGSDRADQSILAGGTDLTRRRFEDLAELTGQIMRHSGGLPVEAGLSLAADDVTLWNQAV
ncbi:MAG TPA: hypothetical protein VJN62_09195 [Gemmatimonadales bacterium]|nr:hypothetical protein [Gemmatimonadales bacterium]